MKTRLTEQAGLSSATFKGLAFIFPSSKSGYIDFEVP